MGGERLLHETTSLCRVCKVAVEAKVVGREDGVFMRKTCAVHGPEEARIARDAGWYERTRATRSRPHPPKNRPKAVLHGCPFDCGACEQHRQRVRLPVVTITSACNLDCPICYVHNKNDGAYHMAREELRGILRHLTAEHGGTLDLINFTGGDPTLHPHLLDFLEMCHEAGIHRVSICTNGLKLVGDDELVRRLKALDARIALSFQSFEEGADFAMQGAHLVKAKLRCLDILEEHDVDTTLIPVATRGLNDHELGAIIELGLGKKNVRHIEVHTMTYTGQGGVSFDRSGRIAMDEVLGLIEDQTGGLLRERHFVPSPCAHPLCYQIAYLLMDPDGGRPVPFLDFVTAEEMMDVLSEHLYLEPSPRLEQVLRTAIDRLWTDDRPDSERTLGILKRLLEAMFPRRPLARRDALRAGEQAVKAVYVHSHMDEETFDVERVMECCDSNCYPDGTSIPVCSYNVLYREKEAHFMAEPRKWTERAGLRLPIVSA